MDLQVALNQNIRLEVAVSRLDVGVSWFRFTREVLLG
jgi:hypothetical protein